MNDQVANDIVNVVNASSSSSEAAIPEIVKNGHS